MNAPKRKHIDPLLVPPMVETPKRAWHLKRINRRPSIKSALITLAIVLAAGLLLPLLAPQNPYDLSTFSVMDNRLPPGEQSLDGLTFWLGTDPQGRDMVSAILYGMRVSLMVGLAATALALAVGVSVGLTAATFGGRIETLLMRLVDFVLGFPSILVALVLLALIGRGVDKVIFAIVMVQWADYARVMRASAMVERQKEYIEAAENLGYSRLRIMFRHLLPNSIAAVLVIATIRVASAITLEATLSFLGVGVPVTEPSLGLLVASGFEFLMSGEYWISVYPGIALVILIFSLNMAGDRLREAFDSRRS